jgi:hypothetical protein
MDPAPESVIDAIVSASPQQATYGTAVDRESAYELLAEKAEKAADAAEKDSAAKETAEAPSRKRAPAKKDKSVVQDVLESKPVNSFLREAGRTVGRELTRSLLGILKR